MDTYADQDNRVSSQEQDMRDRGIPTEYVEVVDYFGTDVRHKVVLPDGRSYVEIKVLNEGERKSIQNASNRDIRFQRASGEAIIRNKPGDERHALLEVAIVGWNLRRRNDQGVMEDVPFTKTGRPGSRGSLGQFLDSAPPSVIDLVQKDVYKHNPWLMQELTVEEIDKQIDELRELRETKVREEEGKGSLTK